MVFLARKKLFLALFRQIQSITFRQKQVFAKILCDRRTRFSCLQILIFPPPLLLSPSSSQLFPPKTGWESVPKAPSKIPNALENPPRKHPQKTLPISQTPRKEKRQQPRKSFVFCLSKGLRGGEEDRKRERRR